MFERHSSWRRTGLVAGVALLLSITVLPGSAAASTGCQALNQAGLDGLYFGKEITLSELNAGDVVTISAGHPIVSSDGNYVPSSLHLILNDLAVVAVAQFPGTLQWTVPNHIQPRLKWITNQENITNRFAEVTWAVGCELTTPARHGSSRHGDPLRAFGTVREP